jgi:uncharacterized ferritin-like protein (DUF455 family)
MTIFTDIINVLNTKNATEKANLVLQIYSQYQNGMVNFDILNHGNIFITPPDYPAYPDKPELLPPNKMPKRSKGFKKKNVLLHALAHIELNAVNLACDMIVRFHNHHLPVTFYCDWLKVAYDEARHFNLLNNYLIRNDCFYGVYPAHDSLWGAAYETRHDLPARLAVVPMVLEARGLDVTPTMITQFNQQGDQEIADILTEIYHDEINHVSIGVKWFEFVTNQPIEKATELFHHYLKKYFRGKLIPPFNVPARDKA